MTKDILMLAPMNSAVAEYLKEFQQERYKELKNKRLNYVSEDFQNCG